MCSFFAADTLSLCVLPEPVLIISSDNVVNSCMIDLCFLTQQMCKMLQNIYIKIHPNAVSTHH